MRARGRSVVSRPRRSQADGREILAVSVWLRLLKARGLLSREVRRRVPCGLTLPQFDVLAQLHRRREGMTPGELTEQLIVSPGNVTGIVVRLLRLGLVSRRPVPEDRRAVRIRLSARGQRLMRDAIPRHRRDVQAMLAPVGVAMLARLRDALGALNHRLEQRS